MMHIHILAKTPLSHSSTCQLRSWGTQFWWLLQRSLVTQLRNPTDVTSRLLLSCWIGLLAGAGPCSWRLYFLPCCQLSV
jgi:hypothetical protein